MISFNNGSRALAKIPGRVVLTCAVVALGALHASPARAAAGDCGQMVSSGITTTASDALFVLRAAVGSQTCEYPCLCDTNGSGSTTSSDALLALKRAVGQDVRLACSCREPALEGLEADAPVILPFRVQAAYNDDTAFFHMSWEGNRGDTHEYIHYADGMWRREGSPRREAQSTLDNDPARGPINARSTIYESRVTFMLDDPAGPNAVPGFYEFGCFQTCHDHSRAMPTWDAVTDLTKHLPDGSDGKLDLWHHRINRANPVGASDDQYVDATQTGGRKTDAGTSVFTTNGQDGSGNPAFVLDPASSKGLYAFLFDNVYTDPLRVMRAPGTPELGGRDVASTLAWADALSAGYVPREGDTVPRRILRQGAGSAADITAFGTEFVPSEVDPLQGRWFSSIQRLLDTGNPDDTALVDGGSYNIAFAVHTGQVTVRDHYISFALRMGLGSGAAVAIDGPQPDLVAVKILGTGRDESPDWNDTETFPVTELNLFKPGIASREFLVGGNVGLTYVDPRTDMPVDQNHVGATGLLSGGLGCRNCHTAATGDPYEPPTAGGFNSGSMQTLAPLRGGVNTPTPIPPLM
ncbi:MAG: ethylbenzene dehydrogenase-related protein [Candidatus Binatia bacterium]